MIEKGTFIVNNELGKSFILSEYALKKLYSYYEKYKLCDSILTYEIFEKEKEKTEKSIYKNATYALASLITMILILFKFAN